MTNDTRHVTGCGGGTFSQNFSFLALVVWERVCFEDWKENDYLLTDYLFEWITNMFAEQLLLHRVCSLYKVYQIIPYA